MFSFSSTMFYVVVVVVIFTIIVVVVVVFVVVAVVVALHCRKFKLHLNTISTLSNGVNCKLKQNHAIY